MKLIQEVYGPEIAKAKRPEEKQQLATKLLQAGVDEQRDAVGRYVLLMLALEYATTSADFETAFKAIETAADSYPIDALSLKTETAANIGKLLRSPQARKEFSAALAPLIDEAAIADRYDIAKQLGDFALSAVRLADAALARQMAGRLQQIRDAAAAFEEAKVAADQLKKNPNDAEANLKLGKFRCFVKHDWKRGLPLLASGTDPSLKKLALRDLAGASTPETQIEVGDGWWDQAEKANGPVKLAMQQRAAQWYQQALAMLDKGLLRQKVEHRLEMVPAKADDSVVAAPVGKGPVDWAVQGPAQYERLGVNRSWEQLHPKTTLAAQRIEGTVVLTRAKSPYLVSGMLLVAPGAHLTIEPGVFMLFAPQVRLQAEGKLTAVSDGPWIVLAPADPKQRWGGVESRDKLELHRCVIDGADIAASAPRGNLSADECVFVESGTAVDIGNNGHGTAQNCVMFKNDLGLTGHGDAGNVKFSHCLLLFNKRGCTANFYGRCEGSNCTFYGNQSAIEAADIGNSVRISLSNILTTTGAPLGSRGGKAIVAGDYWGKSGPPADSPHDVSGPLNEAVKDSVPNLPPCEYLRLSGGSAWVAPRAPALSPQAAAKTNSFLSVDRLMGIWAETNGTRYTFTRDGHFVFAGNQPGVWRLTEDSLILTWGTKRGQPNVGRVDTYTRINGDAIYGQITHHETHTGQPVQINKVKGP